MLGNPKQSRRMHPRLLCQRIFTTLSCAVLALLLTNAAAYADDFTAGDAASLIHAIDSANAAPGVDTITLTDDITLTVADNGDNGLPVVSSEITIDGAGHTIERDSAALPFRLMLVDDDGDLTLDNITLRGGYLTDQDGGGIYNSGLLTIRSSSVISNTAWRGGGLYNTFDAIISDSTIAGNQAHGVGGGLFSTLNRTTITSTTIAGNTAERGGGILAYLGGIRITNSSISGNASTKQGGGIDNSASTLTIRNSTITQNTATRGAGIFNWEYATLTLNRSLVSGNTAVYAGNEINNAPNSTVNVNASNLFGDSSQTTADALVSVTLGASDITATSDGTIPTALNAVLDTNLADNGGPTLSHALLAGSPAIDAAGDGGLDTDQRGVTRPQGTADDIGAFEYENPSERAGDCNADSAVDAGDITASILEIFDGDGSLAADTPNGAFGGSPACDSNGDTLVDAGDVSCTILLIFNGSGACAPLR